MPLLEAFAVDKQRDEFHLPLSKYSDISEALFHAERLSMYSPTYHAVRIYLDSLPIIEVNNEEIQAGLFYWEEVNSFLEVSND